MWSALISADIANDKSVLDSLKSKLRPEGFRLISMCKRLPDIVSHIDIQLPDEEFFAQCVEGLKSSTTERAGIVDTLSSVDYFCISGEEFFRTLGHPFIVRYLLPVLYDETEGEAQILIWDDPSRKWHTRHLGPLRV